MARRPGEPPRRRFGKSGHTTHRPYTVPPEAPISSTPAYPTETYPPPNVSSAARDGASYGSGYDNGYGPASYHGYRAADAASSRPPTPATAGSTAAAVTRGALSHTHRAARLVTRRVISASKAGGAQESGLTALIWNQVLSYGTDAMITVALAGTVFFGASAHAQRGNVLLYLLITMAPFAVIAPVIGPALDRVQHGRRWTMAGTAIGRAVLAVIMAGHPTELLVLYPCALGSLVLSKAYAVVRAAAAPRLVPPGMTLTQANSRLTIFGLGSTLILGAFVGAVIKLTGSYSLGLYLCAIGFAVCAFFGFRLPRQVDSVVAAPQHPDELARPLAQDRVPPLRRRIRSWARRGFDEHLVAALQGEAVLRLLSGLLTIYLAFYVESTAHGFPAALQLGAVVVAAGAGNFTGTAIGSRIRMARPELVILVSVAIIAAVCIVVALVFSIVFAVIGMYVSAVSNAMSKIALDSLIQRDVAEGLRASAFGRSETFLQLAWVVGAAIGVVLPSGSGDGADVFWVAGPVAGLVAIVVFLHQRATARSAAARAYAPPDAVSHDRF
jgi:MFS family permease